MKHLSIVFLLCALSTPVFADKYDDEVKLRKYFENEARKEQANRDAAEARYEKAHPSSGGSSVGGIMGILLIVIMGYVCLKTINEKLNS